MLELQFSPFPELTTERLFLRRTLMSDAPEVFFLRSDPRVIKYLCKVPCASIEEAKEFIQRIDRDAENNDGIQWAVTMKEAPDKMIGSICYWQIQKGHYRAEIGYALDPAYWRKGIMKEAISKVLEYGFNTMGLHSVEAKIGPANAGSAAVLESTGFVREAIYREDFYFNGGFEDTVVYSRLCHDHLQKLSVREATVADIPRIQIIRNAVTENRLSDPALVPDSDVEDYMMRRGNGWVAVLNGTIVGFSIVSLMDKNVWALFVDPANEKKGAGKALHDKMIDWYFQQTGDPIWLGTAPGTRAETFYRKAGWQETGMHGKGEIKFEMGAKEWENHPR